MADLGPSIRRLIHRVPGDPAERSQRLRDDLVERLDDGSRDWEAVRERAKAAHERLKVGELPEAGGSDDEIGSVIHTTCREYHAKEYEMADLRRGIDGMQARAAAKARTESS